MIFPFKHHLVEKMSVKGTLQFQWTIFSRARNIRTAISEVVSGYVHIAEVQDLPFASIDGTYSIYLQSLERRVLCCLSMPVSECLKSF